MTIFELDDVWASYGGAPVLKGVNLEIAEGEILGIAGPNSTGKTTLLRILSKVLTPSRGSIRLLGQEMGQLSRLEVARIVACVPQEVQPIFPFTVREMVLMGRYPHARRFFFETQEDLAVAEEAMMATGVLHLADKFLDQLSGGERQRAIIARALAQRPKVLLLDEPTVHLDLHHQAAILNLLKTLNRKRRTTIVLVSHDLNVAATLADHLLLLKDGEVYRIGPPEEVLEEKTLEEVYGCRVLIEKGPTGRPLIWADWS